jgi:hypothetical protein
MSLPMSRSTPLSGNRLVENPALHHAGFIAACELVTLNYYQIVYEKSQPLTHVHFPLTAILVEVAELSAHHSLGLVQIGNEGMHGATLVLGIKTAPLRVLVHGAGTALRMDVNTFQAFLRDIPSLSATLGRYLHLLLQQIARTAACTHFHEVDARVVRWLLLTHDRALTDHFRLTHQLLADMLGVRRSSVSIAAGLLQNKHLISYSRGEINVLDRAGLEALCCQCYQGRGEDYKLLSA